MEIFAKQEGHHGVVIDELLKKARNFGAVRAEKSVQSAVMNTSFLPKLVPCVVNSAFKEKV